MYCYAACTAHTHRADDAAAAFAAAEKTAHVVELAHQIGAAKKPARLPVAPKYPIRLEEEMGNRYVKFIDRARPYYDHLKAGVMKLLGQLADRGDARTVPELRADAGEVAAGRDMLAAAQTRWSQWVTPQEMETLAAYYGSRASIAQRADLGRVIRAALGVDVPLDDVVTKELISDYAKATAELVDTIPKRLHADIASLTIRALTKRMLPETFAGLLEGRFGIGENHARYIARNQLSHLNATLNEERQTQLGITHYFWLTEEDDRVRPLHNARWHKRFAWAEPPSVEPYDGHPGHPPNCRCVAAPDLTPIIAAIRRRRRLNWR